MRSTVYALEKLNLKVEFYPKSDLKFRQHDPFAISKIKCKKINSSKGESYQFIAKNNIIGEWEVKRSKTIVIDGVFFSRMIKLARNSKDRETRFHTLPAGKKEK